MIAPGGACFFKHFSGKKTCGLYRIEIKSIKFWFYKAMQMVGRVVMVSKNLLVLCLYRMLVSPVVQTQRLCIWNRARLVDIKSPKSKRVKQLLKHWKGRMILQAVHRGLSGHELGKKSINKVVWYSVMELKPFTVQARWNFPQAFSNVLELGYRAGKKKVCVISQYIAYA